MMPQKWSAKPHWYLGVLLMSNLIVNENLLLAKQFYDVSIAIASTAIQQAIRSGEHFTKAKEELPHGEFIPAVEALGIDRSTAAKYMKIAREYPNVENSPHLGSVSAALEFLRSPAEVQQQVAQIESPISAAEIRKMKEDLEAEKLSRESWRKQSLGERDRKRELQLQLNETIAKVKELRETGATDPETARRITQLESQAHRREEKVKKLERDIVKQSGLVKKQFDQGVSRGREMERTTINNEGADVLTVEIDGLKQEKRDLQENLANLKAHEHAIRSSYKGIEQLHSALLDVSMTDNLTPDALKQWVNVRGAIANIGLMLDQVCEGAIPDEGQVAEYVETAEQMLGETCHE
jgi:hypothetical protein